MTGILNMLLGGVSGITTSTFNIIAGAISSTVLAGYDDGTAGTSGGAGGSISGSSSFGGKHIAEISYDNTSLNVDRLRIKGFGTNPGQAWMTKVIANSVTRTGASATFTWDSVNGCATWQWSGGSFGFINGNTYNNCTITHGP